MPNRSTIDAQAESNRSHGISVIIPCYNYGRFLSQAITSVLEQNFAPIEIIVINDGSTDNTAEVAKSFGNRIKYLVQANQGVSAARNFGIRNAVGEFLHFLDADDYVQAGFYHELVAALQSRADAVAAYSGCNWVDVAGKLIFSNPARPESADVFHDLLLINQWPLVSILMRSNAVKSVGGFDEEMQASCEDWDLWMRLAATGGRFVPVNRILACYRQQPQGASGNPKRMLLNGLAVISRYAHQHGCEKCKINSKKGRREWRHFCVIDKFLPKIEPYLEQGRLFPYLRECGQIAAYDPLVAWQCFWRLRQRKRLALAGLFGRKVH